MCAGKFDGSEQALADTWGGPRQGSDGYHRHFQGFGQIYSGPVKSGTFGAKDYLQVQDLNTGETQYFRFQFM